MLAIDENSPPKVDVALAQILIAGLGSSPARFKIKEPTLITINKSELWLLVAEKKIYSNVLAGNILLEILKFKIFLSFIKAMS